MWWLSDDWTGKVRVWESKRTERVSRLISADWLNEQGCDYADGRATLLRDYGQQVEYRLRPVNDDKGDFVFSASPKPTRADRREYQDLCLKTFDKMPRSHALWRAQSFTVKNGTVYSVCWWPWDFTKANVAPVMQSEEIRRVEIRGTVPRQMVTHVFDTRTTRAGLRNGLRGEVAFSFGHPSTENEDGVFPGIDEYFIELLSSFMSANAARGAVRRFADSGDDPRPPLYALAGSILPSVLAVSSQLSQGDTPRKLSFPIEPFRNLVRHHSSRSSLIRCLWECAFYKAREWAGLKICKPLECSFNDLNRHHSDTSGFREQQRSRYPWFWAGVDNG